MLFVVKSTDDIMSFSVSKDLNWSTSWILGSQSGERFLSLALVWTVRFFLDLLRFLCSVTRLTVCKRL